jgi:peptidoglycan hydrolase-like protein with peptidoglycan-binding domain
MKTVATSLLLALVIAAPAPAIAQPRTSPETPAATKPGPDTSTAPAASGTARANAGGGRIQAIQTALKDKGYDPGPVDGRMGPQTRAALRAYQKKEGLPATGNADAKTLAGLNVAAARDAGPATPRNTQKTEAKKAGPGASTTTPQAEMAKDADTTKKK